MSPTRRRTWLLTGAVVVALVAGIVLFARNTGGPTASASPCRLATPPSAAPTAGGPGVIVIDKGHRTVVGDSPWASMGAVLRNTTDQVAYRTEVTFDPLDANGRTVVWTNHSLFRTQVVPVIAPGASVAVGISLAMDRNAGAAGQRITSVGIDVRTTQWLPSGTGADGLGEVRSTLTPGSGKRAADAGGSVAYTTESPNCAAMVSRGVSMVFRDGSGAIVGGTLNNKPEPGVCEPGRHEVAGTNTGQPGIPADADLDRTTVTVYCDFDSPQRLPASGVPYN